MISRSQFPISCASSAYPGPLETSTHSYCKQKFPKWWVIQLETERKPPQPCRGVSFPGLSIVENRNSELQGFIFGRLKTTITNLWLPKAPEACVILNSFHMDFIFKKDAWWSLLISIFFLKKVTTKKQCLHQLYNNYIYVLHVCTRSGLKHLCTMCG